MIQGVEGSLDGKVCLVTGATRGIGYATASGLANAGAKVILVGHHQGRGEEAQSKINRIADREASQFFSADLSSMEAIEVLAEDVKAQYDRLDVLINNAGAYFLGSKASVDGYEMTFALNHLNYFKLTLLLLDLILKSEPARIINVSSGSHRKVTIDIDELRQKKGFYGFRAYGQSKLANLLFTYELDRRLPGDEVTVNALHPGFVRSHFGKQNLLMRPVMAVLHFLFGKSPEEGAETPLYLATSREGGEKSGKYFIDKQMVDSSPQSYDECLAAELWELSKELSGLTDFELHKLQEEKFVQ